MKATIITFLFIIFCVSVKAQDTRAVEAAVRNYVEGFYYGDTTKILASVSPELVKVGYGLRDQSNYEKIPMTFRQAVNYAANVARRGVTGCRKIPKENRGL